MQNYKDTNNKVHVLDDVTFEHLLPAGCVKITEAEADALCPKYTPIQLKNAEIKERTNQYKLDIQTIQFSWLSATILDGTTEVSKKESLQTDIYDLKTEYDSDIAAIKLKYQTL